MRFEGLDSNHWTGVPLFTPLVSWNNVTPHSKFKRLHFFSGLPASTFNYTGMQQRCLCVLCFRAIVLIGCRLDRSTQRLHLPTLPGGRERENISNSSIHPPLLQNEWAWWCFSSIKLLLCRFNLITHWSVIGSLISNGKPINSGLDSSINYKTALKTWKKNTKLPVVKPPLNFPGLTGWGVWEATSWRAIRQIWGCLLSGSVAG